MTKTKKTIKERIESEHDYICCPRLGNSLKSLINLNPDGVDNKRIAKVLCMTEQEVEDMFGNIIKKIQKEVGV